MTVISDNLVCFDGTNLGFTRSHHLQAPHHHPLKVHPLRTTLGPRYLIFTFFTMAEKETVVQVIVPSTAFYSAVIVVVGAEGCYVNPLIIV